MWATLEVIIEFSYNYETVSVGNTGLTLCVSCPHTAITKCWQSRLLCKSFLTRDLHGQHRRCIGKDLLESWIYYIYNFCPLPFSLLLIFVFRYLGFFLRIAMNENRSHKQIFIIFYDILKCYKLWMNRSFRRVLSASGLCSVPRFDGYAPRNGADFARTPSCVEEARDRKRLTDLNWIRFMRRENRLLKFW